MSTASTGRQLVLDTKRNMVGVIVDRHAEQVQLQPQGGGQEWFALPEDVQPIDAIEALSLRVRELNRRCQEGRH